VQGNKVVFPQDSPQVASLVVEPVAPCKGSAIRLNGRLLWDDDVTVRVFTPFGGRITKILAEVGQTVTPGEPLAQIASPDYGQAQAEARKAATDFILAERTLNRVKELFEHGAAPQKDFQSAEAEFDRAQSEKQRTAARLALYGGNANAIGDVFALQSPLRGVVVEKNINPGQEVRSDQMLANAPQLFSPLFVLTDPSRLWIQLDATEQDAPRLKRGQEIVIRCRAYPDQVFKGRIEVINDSLDPSTRTVKVRGTVDNSQRLLKGEMFVTVELPVTQQVGFDVSPQAVFLKGTEQFVFLEERPGTYARRKIKIGSEHEGKIQIIDGIQPGERVVTNGTLLLEQVLQSGEGG
jgi:cobalt-zinc-cadmium efflux system membrane fusion protein